MDLGKVKLPRAGLNSLQQAIHPVHGIAWTDGKQVCLTSFHCDDRAEPKFGDTNVVGQFEHVLGLRWGPACSGGSPALLAVQHKKHATVWQLQREQNKLLCEQTCEASEPLPLLAQGCVWHPRVEALALLTKRDASVLYSAREDNRRVRAEIGGGGLVRCACWTGDGARLVVAVGTALHSFIWDDAQRTLTACSFCPVFDVGGDVCALESVGDVQVAAATELPLDRICGLNAGMAFEVPPSAGPPRPPSPQPPVLTAGGESRRRSVDSDRSLLPRFLSSSPCGPVDLTHILARHRRSDPSPLIHLRRRDTLTGSGQDSSHLIVVTYERKATTSRKLSVPGILAPDIIALDPGGRAVAVASNACSLVLVYGVSTATMPNLQRIQLQRDERPKGMCFLGNRRLLLMVGKQKSSDPAFLSSSNTDRYLVHLLTKDLVYDDDDDDKAAGKLPVQNPQDPSFTFPSANRSSESISKAECFGGITDLMLPGGVLVPSPGGRRRLIEEVLSGEVLSEDSSPTVSLTDFSEAAASSVSMETLASETGRGAVVRPVTGRESSPSSSPRLEPSDPTLPRATARPVDQLAQSMEGLVARFAEVQKSLSEFRDFAQNGRKTSACYPSCAEPPYITVTCQRQVSENVFIEERRPVLLSEGKLSLRVLQDLFNMHVLEMLHNSLWIVLVADVDGFVPLTFKPKEELTVRNGKQKLPRSPSSGDTLQSGSL